MSRRMTHTMAQRLAFARLARLELEQAGACGGGS